MTRTISITRRLIVTVLLLESLAALALIAAVTVNQRHIQFKIFDANLRGTADSIMGAVQETDDKDDNVMLDLRGLRLAHNAIYSVQEDQGRRLGSSGSVPAITAAPENFQDVKIEGRSYRFFVHHGERIIDPGNHSGGIHHSVTIVYGLPVGRVWHEVFEATRFFAIATGILLGITTLLMVWLVRRWLQPIHELASEAEAISSVDWRFEAPESAKQTVELRPLANALETTIARLQRSFEQQKRFTSDAAHELKTDVAIVKSSLQLLSMKKRNAEEYSRGLALSLDDFTRLEHTVQKMLTLARLEQPIETQGHSCSMKEAIEEAVQQSSAFAALRDISVSVRADSNAHVLLDNRDAALLCSNILLNALQHSPEGGTVNIDLESEDTQIRLTVRDHGEGLSEEDRQFLFEPFYRGDASRSRKSGGTGLGLSICQAICRRIDGSIAIANHPEGGAVVEVVLPQRRVEEKLPLSGSVKA